MPQAPSFDARAPAHATPSTNDLARLAFAVAADQNVTYLKLGPRGKKIRDGFGSINDAVRSGRAFMVMPSANTLAIDADSDVQMDALRVLVSEVEEIGIRPVRVRSGRGLHLFARMAPRLVEEFATRGRTRDLDVRRRSPIRPPLSPHPAGLAVSLVDLTVAEAIEALTTLPSPTRPNQVSQRIKTMLRTGRYEDRYASGSEAVQAVATAFVNAGLSWPQFRDALTNPNNGLSEVLQRHEPAEKWLRRSWDKAEEFVQAHPLRYSAGELLDTIDAVHAHAAYRELPSMTRAVLTAHVAAALRVGHRKHALGEAQCGIDAGCSGRTARVHRKRLVEIGFLARVEQGGGEHAAVWNLQAPPTGVVNSSPLLLTPPRDEIRGEAMTTLDIGADAYRHGALGKGGIDVVAVLQQAHHPMTAPAIQRAIPVSISLSTVRRVLRTLRDCGYVFWCPEGWMWCGELDDGLQRVAEKKGTDGKRQQAIEQLEEERRLRRAGRYDFVTRNRPLGPPT